MFWENRATKSARFSRLVRAPKMVMIRRTRFKRGLGRSVALPIELFFRLFCGGDCIAKPDSGP